jgi:bifunctional pyridoxal-dependent enzyme with beta-cystathionase and maltose regulon repressor activities
MGRRRIYFKVDSQICIQSPVYLPIHNEFSVSSFKLVTCNFKLETCNLQQATVFPNTQAT